MLLLYGYVQKKRRTATLIPIVLLVLISFLGGEWSGVNVVEGATAVDQVVNAVWSVFLSPAEKQHQKDPLAHVHTALGRCVPLAFNLIRTAKITPKPTKPQQNKVTSPPPDTGKEAIATMAIQAMAELERTYSAKGHIGPKYASYSNQQAPSDDRLKELLVANRAGNANVCQALTLARCTHRHYTTGVGSVYLTIAASHTGATEQQRDLADALLLLNGMEDIIKQEGKEGEFAFIKDLGQRALARWPPSTVLSNELHGGHSMSPREEVKQILTAVAKLREHMAKNQTGNGKSTIESLLSGDEKVKGEIATLVAKLPTKAADGATILLGRFFIGKCAGGN